MRWFALDSEVTNGNTYLQLSFLAAASVTEMQTLTAPSVVLPGSLSEIQELRAHL